MSLQIILFIVGFFILVKGAGVLIDGASSLARLFKVSTWVIGAVIVGIGTSIPEFSINLAAVFNGGQIGVATVIGSNTFNILFILGFSALLTPLVMKKEWVRKEFVVNGLVILAAGLMAFAPVAGPANFLGITRAEGFILFLLFLLWLWFEVHFHQEREKEARPAKIFTFFTSSVLIAIGLAGVFLGGKWVVEGAELLARSLGASETLIGLTIVGMGTSIPELTVSLAAVIKRQSGIAVGNVIGSNIFDFLGIFSIIPLIKPLPFSTNFVFDLSVTFGATLLLLTYMFIGKRYTLKRWQGAAFLLIYAAYLVFLISRG